MWWGFCEHKLSHANITIAYLLKVNQSECMSYIYIVLTKNCMSEHQSSAFSFLLMCSFYMETERGEPSSERLLCTGFSHTPLKAGTGSTFSQIWTVELHLEWVHLNFISIPQCSIEFCITDKKIRLLNEPKSLPFPISQAAWFRILLWRGAEKKIRHWHPHASI